MSKKHDVRLHSSFQSTPEDLARAAQLPLDACPRRYCWWWRSLAFEWDVSVEEGCCFAQRASRTPGYKNVDVPCCRNKPGTKIDHHEPREPGLEEDGFDWYRFSAKR